MTAKDVILHWVVPILGGLVAVVMFTSPIKAVLRARRERVLGDLNPLPFPAIVANCAGWVGYSYVVRDALIFWPNDYGLLIGLFFTLSCYGVADSKTRDRQLAIMLVFSLLLTVVGAVGALGELSRGSLRLLWGYTANAILLVYYAAPLSTVLEVVRSRSSASLHWPLALMNAINGVLWLAYGLATKDYFIWVPNGIGALVALGLLALILVFPAKPRKHSPTNSEAGTVSSARQLTGAASDPDLAARGGSADTEP